MQFSNRRLTVIMEAKLFEMGSKRVFQISFIGIIFSFLLARTLGWTPSIHSIERLSGVSPLGCFFHRWTGYDCPGCGLTRSLLSFFAGDVGLSFYFHPLGPILGVGACLFFVTSLIGRRQDWSHFLFFKKWRWSFLVLLMSWGVLRNF